MKASTLLTTTILSTGFMLSPVPFAHAADITTRTVATATKPISAEAMADPRVAATSFVEHINYARVALAMKNPTLASQHIMQARNMETIIKSATTEQQRVNEVEFGRVVYSYDTVHKYHYFPIQTGPVQVKQVSSGPIWTKNDLAVTDADIVYLTLDLSGTKTETALNAADAAIAANNLPEAETQLAMLTDAVVTVESRNTVPSDKAHDNISLARNFIVGGNYEGASYALGHADEALDEMRQSDLYKVHRNEIIAMRKDVKALQGYIAKKDPTMIQKANKKMNIWWKDLKGWSASAQ